MQRNHVKRAFLRELPQPSQLPALTPPALASRSLRLSSVLQVETPPIQSSPEAAVPSELVAALISIGHRGNA
jgi:hypothetical protein